MTVKEVARKYYNKYFDDSMKMGREEVVELLIKDMQENNEMKDFLIGIFNIVIDQDIILKHYEAKMNLRSNDPIDLSKPYTFFEDLDKKLKETKKLLKESKILFDSKKNEELTEALKPVEITKLKNISENKIIDENKTIEGRCPRCFAPLNDDKKCEFCSLDLLEDNKDKDLVKLEKDGWTFT